MVSQAVTPRRLFPIALVLFGFAFLLTALPLAHAVEGDFDDDGISDFEDNCFFDPNPDQTDTDFDFFGDACDPEAGSCFSLGDDDGDGLTDCDDPDCEGDPFCVDTGDEICNNFEDDDGDEFFDCEDPDCAVFPLCIDTDFDFIPDIFDNCPETENTDQTDSDFNGIGDACQDGDGDGVLDTVDNCLEVPNPDQAETDGNGIGNACQETELVCNNGSSDDTDELVDCEDPDCATAQVCSDLPDNDGDGIPNVADNCPEVANPDQADNDGEGAGNACDSTPDGSPDDSNLVDAGADSGGSGCGLALASPGGRSYLPWTAAAGILAVARSLRRRDARHSCVCDLSGSRNGG